MKWLRFILVPLILGAAGWAIVIYMKDPKSLTEARLAGFSLNPSDYGWNAHFPNRPQTLFGHEVGISIDTRIVPTEPEQLPPISKQQAVLVREIEVALPAILKRVEEAMVTYNDYDPNFRVSVKNPHVWLDSERDDGVRWSFVIERTDNPDFGYHIEFKGTNYVEIWAGD